MGISRATLADAHRLSALAIETFPLACPPGTTAENIELFCTEKLSPEAFEAYMSEGRYRIWIAEENGSLRGYVMSVSGEPEDPDIARAVVHRPTVEVSKIYVLSSAHGSGLSDLLMRTAVDDARNGGAASVWLGVNQLNDRANRFYAKHGFELVGERSFQVGDSLEADFVREKVL